MQSYSEKFTELTGRKCFPLITSISVPLSSHFSIITLIFTDHLLCGPTVLATGNITVSKTRLPLAQWKGLVLSDLSFPGCGCNNSSKRKPERQTVNDVLYRAERVRDLFKFTQSCNSDLAMPRAFPVPTCSPLIFIHFLMQGAEGGKA